METQESQNATTGRDEAASEHREESTSHIMVDPSRQPGSMQYPFATHGPPPEDTDDEHAAIRGPADVSSGPGESTLSAAFVVGAIIIAAVMLIGLILAAQQRQIRGLRDRVETIEQSLNQGT